MLGWRAGSSQYKLGKQTKDPRRTCASTLGAYVSDLKIFNLSEKLLYYLIRLHREVRVQDKIQKGKGNTKRVGFHLYFPYKLLLFSTNAMNKQSFP